MKIRIGKIFEIHWLITLFIMLISTIAIASTSINLFHLFQANFGYIAEHGLMALADDGAWQLLSLVANAIAASSSYIMFRASEEVLIAKILGR